ncbi:MAG TPA: hypothetical protein H9887_05215, partial [Candidatus Dorea intestinavium]|nr:hypothetical protein [Candidatus Dorea intestinavium]
MKKKTILILVTALCFLFSGCVRVKVLDKETGAELEDVPVTGYNSNGDLIDTLTTNTYGDAYDSYDHLRSDFGTYTFSVPTGTYNGNNYLGTSISEIYDNPDEDFENTIYLERIKPIVIDGDDTITLEEGYLSTSFSYQVTSNPAAVLSLSDTLNNHLSIDSLGNLSIYSGLSAGEYPFVITSTNGYETTTKGVLLKIAATPSITGNSNIKLLKGYEGYTEKYDLANTTTVALSNDLDGLLVINSEGLLTIAKGLNNGVYQTTIVLSNENAETTLDLTINVNEAPTISGDDKIDLLLGYKALTKSYSISAFPNPSFSVTELSDSELLQAMMPEGGEVVNGTINLTIAEGLTVGTYKVELNATNGLEPNAKKVVTINVSKADDDKNDQYNANTNSNSTNTAKSTAVNTGDLVSQPYILLLATIFLLSLTL